MNNFHVAGAPYDKPADWRKFDPDDELDPDDDPYPVDHDILTKILGFDPDEPDEEQETSRFAKADDCGHTPEGEFSHGNTCAGLKRPKLGKFADDIKHELKHHFHKLPKPVQKHLKRAWRTYNSSFSITQRTAHVLARKHGMNRHEARKLTNVLTMLDFSASSAIDLVAGAASPILDKIPVASTAYIFSHMGKRPLHTLSVAQRAVKRVMKSVVSPSHGLSRKQRHKLMDMWDKHLSETE